MKKIFRIIFSCIFSCLVTTLLMLLFRPIFHSQSIIVDYGFITFDVCKKLSFIWNYISQIFFFSSFLTYLIIGYNISFYFIKDSINENNLAHYPTELNLYIGKNTLDEDIFINESGLYQNFLITGTIGSGKTSSVMYPLTRQLIKYHFSNNSKIGMLILDVKGNYYKKVQEYCKQFNRIQDLIVIELGGKYKYNPLHKPNLKPSILANRLKTILTLFSPNNTESYWLDEAEKVLTECIKLCRLYNDGYVNFIELHKLITVSDYYLEKIELLRNLFQQDLFDEVDLFDLSTSLDFFEKEFYNLDSRVLSILKSEITRITNIFVSDYDVLSTFCPEKDDLNFLGFDEVIHNGKIVVLNMNIANYRNLSKIISAYLKLDFQTEVLSNLSKNSYNCSAFICDEYHEYVTSNDADFFAQSREAKCINIVSTQSYTSLLNTLKDNATVKVIIQNLINKLWLRTDDIFTIEEAQKQIGKEEKSKISRTISENAKETNFDILTRTLRSKNSNISESINSYTQFDYKYDTNFFTRELETFSCLSFLSTGEKILPPQKIYLQPYFKNEKEDLDYEK